jgi:hypothetical protein
MSEVCFMYLILYIFRAVVLHINFDYYYQLLHDTSIYSYVFRLTVVAVIRESLFIDLRCLEYVIEW